MHQHKKKLSRHGFGILGGVVAGMVLVVRRPISKRLLVALTMVLGLWSNGPGLAGEVPVRTVQVADVIAYHIKGDQPADFDVGSATPAEGRLGEGLLVDGVDDTASLKAPTLPGPKTIEAWFRPEPGGSNGRRMIVSHFYFGAADNKRGFGLAWAWGQVWGMLADGSKRQVDLASPQLDLNGKWTHVAMTHDPFDGLARLFVNGQQVDIVEIEGFTPSFNYHSLRLGSGIFAPNAFYKGAIDEVRLYDWPLTPAQVKRRFESPETEITKLATKTEWVRRHRLRIGLFNRWQPLDKAEVLKDVRCNVALVATVDGRPRSIDLDNYAAWSRALSRRGIKYLPYVWWTPDYYRQSSGQPGKPVSPLRHVNRGGYPLNAPCPLDELYWHKQVRDGFAKIATLPGEMPLFGIGIDLEMYGTNAGETYSTHCYCDHCMKLFLESEARDNDPLPPPEDRFVWLRDEGLRDRFRRFESQRVRDLATEAARAAHAVDPSLLFAIVDYQGNWFMMAVGDGFRETGAPLLACMEGISYRPGYTPAIDRQKQAFQEKKGMLLIPGLWLDFWEPGEDFARHAYLLGRHGDGYFFGPAYHLWPEKPDQRSHGFIEALRAANAELKRADASPDYRSRFVAEDGQTRLPSATVPRLVKPPTLDGKLDDAVWADATELSPFILNDGSGRPAKVATLVKVGYDDKALYLAIDCVEDRMGEIKAALTERDSAVYSEDCVEVFLDVAGEATRYVHLALNPLGTQYDGRKSEVEWSQADPEWDGEWQAAADRRADGWALEIAVPFATLGLDEPPHGGTWRANFARQRRVQSEVSTWSGLKGPFHQPLQFGELTFVGVEK